MTDPTPSHQEVSSTQSSVTVIDEEQGTQEFEASQEDVEQEDGEHEHVRTGRTSNALNWHIAYCFLFTFDQASKYQELEHRFFDGQMKWAAIHEYMTHQIELKDNIEWLKSSPKPLVLLKNKSRAILNRLCAQNPASKFCFSGQSADDFVTLIPGAKQFLSRTLQIVDAEEKLHKAQAQVLEPVERFWYQVLNEESDIPIFNQTQLKRIADFRDLVYKSKTPENILVPQELRPNEEFRKQLRSVKGRDVQEVVRKKLELIENYGYTLNAAIAKRQIQAAARYKQLLQGKALSLTTEHLQHFEKAEKFCIEHCKERGTAHEELKKSLAEIKEQLTDLTEIKEQQQHIIDLLDNITKILMNHHNS